MTVPAGIPLHASSLASPSKPAMSMGSVAIISSRPTRLQAVRGRSA
jgi:hypothetical protein